MAQTDPFSRRMADYKKWRDEVTLTIAEYQAWIDHQGLGNGVEEDRKSTRLNSSHQ